SHPVRPVGYDSFKSPSWDALFRILDSCEMGLPLETRYPFMDLRLMRYMLAVPVIPWCRAKYLERHAMRGILPDSVLHRAKSPLTRDPAWEGAHRFGLGCKQPVRTLDEYINF